MVDNKVLTQKVGKLFKKYGIKSITMDDIAAEMGMSKKTLYQIVADKKELVELAMDSEYRYFKNKLIEITRENNSAVLALIKINALLYEFLSEFSQAADYDLQKYHCKFYDKIKLKYVNLFLSIIQNNIIIGKKEGVYRKELNAEMISKLHLSRIEQIPNSKIFTLEEFTSPAFVKEICLYHMYGIINKAGKQELEKYINKIDILLKPEVV